MGGRERRVKGGVSAKIVRTYGGEGGGGGGKWSTARTYARARAHTCTFGTHARILYSDFTNVVYFCLRIVLHTHTQGKGVGLSAGVLVLEGEGWRFRQTEAVSSLFAHECSTRD